MYLISNVFYEIYFHSIFQQVAVEFLKSVPETVLGTE